MNASWNASGINPAFTGAFPELIDDSYATIGLDGPASAGPVGSEDPLLIEGDVPVINNHFTTNGSDGFEVNSFVGASWFVLGSATNGLGDQDQRALVMQVTTGGSISGQLNYQVFPLGNGSEEQRISTSFNGAGIFGESQSVVATLAVAQIQQRQILILLQSTMMGLVNSCLGAPTRLHAITTLTLWKNDVLVELDECGVAVAQVLF